MRKIFLISKTVLIEAIRRKEIYALVLITTLLILFIGSIRFFNLEGIGKFYREISLKIMNTATALAVVFLAAVQLPREFDKRTIYPLLAKPVSRLQFILGKFIGVIFAGVFCYFLFSILFIIGIIYIKTNINWMVYLQHCYLIILMICIIASLSFVLSLIMHTDAAITITALLYLLAQIYITAISFLYDFVGRAGQLVLIILNYIIPQLSLFDLSAKIIHTEVWGPIGFWAIRDLTIYAFIYIITFLGISLLLFRKRAL